MTCAACGADVPLVDNCCAACRDEGPFTRASRLAARDRKFAWLPTKMNDDHYLWLRHYHEKQYEAFGCREVSRRPAQADTHPQGGDAKQAPFMSGPVPPQAGCAQPSDIPPHPAIKGEKDAD